jgi:hypothetical protein
MRQRATENGHTWIHDKGSNEAPVKSATHQGDITCMIEIKYYATTQDKFIDNNVTKAVGVLRTFTISDAYYRESASACLTRMAGWKLSSLG